MFRVRVVRLSHHSQTLLLVKGIGIPPFEFIISDEKLISNKSTY